ncbi:MAG TPA: hypothetical protein PLD57_04730, partial [Aggregatilineales bacterium]|nr:hypothetical protein [Aggregatilineales bacterium]
MSIPKTLVRAGVALAAILVIVLAGGTWIASAQGTVPAPPPGGGPAIIRAWDEILDGAPDWVRQSLASWFSAFAAQRPCAFFQTQWGQVRIPLDGLEACLAAAGNLTVMCINSFGQLVTNTVTDFGVSPDGGTLYLESMTRQDGHCGIFIGSRVVAPGVISPAPADILRAWDLTDPYTSAADFRIRNELPNWFRAFAEFNPCGFFPTRWGRQSVSLETTEGCIAMAGNLTVMCIGSDANLTQTTVGPGSVGVSPDGRTLYWTFTGMQDGHCG